MGIRRGSISTPIIADGLVFNMDPANRACYPKTGTTATDTIGNTSGTLNGATFSNVNSGVFNFDGTDDYIDCGTSTAIASASSFSVSSWIKIDTGGSFFTSGTSNTDRTFLSIDSSNVYFGVKTGSGGVISWANSFTSIWHHIVGVGDAGTSYLYVDGIERATGSVNTLSSTAGNNVKIGNTTAPMTSSPFDGNIGPVHIYNRALSSNEVLHNYNALKSRFGL